MTGRENKIGYHYIIFDLDETLFDYKSAQRIALKKTMEQAGLPYNAEIQSAFASYNAELWRMLEKGEITQEKLSVKRFDYLAARFGFENADTTGMKDDYERNLGGEGILLKGAREVCEGLCGRVPLAIATNGIPYVQHNRLKKSGISGYFTHIFISGEIGFSKPDIRFFEYMLDKLGITKPETALMIGDSLTSDILGGSRAGMTTCWINSGSANNEIGILPNFEIKSLGEIENLIFPNDPTTI